jgi:hypothetical protein
MQGTEKRIPEGIFTAIPYCCQDVRQSHMIKLLESNAVDFLCVISIFLCNYVVITRPYL